MSSKIESEIREVLSYTVGERDKGVYGSQRNIITPPEELSAYLVTNSIEERGPNWTLLVTRELCPLQNLSGATWRIESISGIIKYVRWNITSEGVFRRDAGESPPQPVLVGDRVTIVTI